MSDETKDERTHRAPTEKTKREEALARFEAACKEAARQRTVNKDLRQSYRSNRAKREKVRAAVIADLQRVYNSPDNPYAGWAASRKRYRELGHYPEVLVADLFGTHAEFERAANLRDLRGTAKVQLTTARLATEKSIREYAEECVMPHVGKWEQSYRVKSGVKQILVGSDFHSQFVDPLALRVWLDVVEMVKPDGVVFNGDVFDFPTVGRYTQMPGAGSLSIQDEIDFGREKILRATVDRMTADAWRTLHIGNHEQRLIRYIADTAPELASLRSLRWDRLLELDGLGIEMVFGGNWMAPKQSDRSANIRRTWKVYYDCLMVKHGDSIARNASDVEMRDAGMTITCGHTHRPGLVFGGQLSRPNVSSTHTGMMAGYAVGKEYARTPEAWTMGFALFTIDVANGIVAPQPIMVTEDFATFCGRVWRPTEKERGIRRAMWGEAGDVTAHVRRD